MYTGSFLHKASTVIREDHVQDHVQAMTYQNKGRHKTEHSKQRAVLFPVAEDMYNNYVVNVEYLQLSAFLLKEAVLFFLFHVTACQPMVLLLQSLQLTCQLHKLHHNLN